MGKPIPMKVGILWRKSESVPREVKHFSTWWKIKQCRASDDISLVVASEKGGAQTNRTCMIGVVRQRRPYGGELQN